MMKLKLGGSKRSNHTISVDLLGTVAVIIVGLIGVGLSFLD